MVAKLNVKNFLHVVKKDGPKLLATRNNFIILGALISLLVSQPLFAQAGPSQLAKSIRAAIEKYYHDILVIEVTVRDQGDVVLKGSTPTYWDWRNVLDIVSHVPGVVYMREEIVVLPREQQADKVIKDAIMNGLHQDAVIIAPDNIQVSVRNGLVLLQGKVLFGKEALMAEEIASWQRGVRSVANEIQVVPPPHPDEELAASLTDMINTYFPLERKTVQLKVEKGQAILNGSVQTLWAKLHIEKEIKRIVGVTDIQNNIKVIPA